MRHTTMQNRNPLLLAALFLLAAAGGCDSPSGPREPVPSTVQVAAPDSTLRVGRTLQLAAEVRDAAGKPIPAGSVAWSSSDTTLARVSATGEVTGVRRGSVRITAAAGEATGSVTLRVFSPVAYVTVESTGLGRVVQVGGTWQVRAVAQDSARRELPDVPVRLTSRDPAVFTVGEGGVVRGVAAGTAPLVAEAEGVAGFVNVFVAQGYDVVALGTLGGAASRALGLGEGGQVVGEAQTAGGAWRAFLWRDGAMAEVAAPGARSRAVAVNAAGAVVGNFWATQDTAASTRPFLWSGGAAVELAPSHPAEHVFATDVNGRGQVVGYSATACPTCPFGTAGSALLWEGGELRDLGRWGGHQAVAAAIDEQGWIAGTVQPQDSAVLLADGQPRRIFPGFARATRGAGHVAGDSRGTGGGEAAWFIFRDNVLHPQPIFYRDRLRVFGIDTQGRTLAQLNYGGFGPVTPPLIVVRQPYGALLQVNQLLAPGTPWQVEGAGAMNDRGDIVGWGRRPGDAAPQALLLRPRG
ncbi:MAG: Ig-like domain-containing protein [Gemmatimonadota bacterium]